MQEKAEQKGRRSRRHKFAEAGISLLSDFYDLLVLATDVGEIHGGTGNEPRWPRGNTVNDPL